MATENERTLMLYDGVCGLCDFAVQFILSRDRHDRFQFLALQSKVAAEILTRHGKSTDAMTTFFVVDNLGQESEVCRERGRAAVHVLKRLGGIWFLLALLSTPVPNVLLNWGYSLIARNRYRFFGKLDACRIPTAAERAKFVDVEPA